MATSAHTAADHGNISPTAAESKLCNRPLLPQMIIMASISSCSTRSSHKQPMCTHFAHRQAATWIGIAAGEQARVVLFPEMALTGYFTSSVLALAGETGSAKVANARLRAAEDVVAAACRKHGIYAIVGVPVFFADVNATSTRCEGPCDRPWFNTALVIDPSGKKQYRQAKLYPCCKQVSSTESAFFFCCCTSAQRCCCLLRALSCVALALSA
jgi:hypothetical protein